MADPASKLISSAAIEVPDISVPDFLLAKIDAFGDAVAMVEGPTGRELTYSAMKAQIRAVAAGLTARGFKKGDVLAIISPNLPEYAVAFHACAIIGGIITPLNPLYQSAEIAHQLKDSCAKFLLTVSMFVEKAEGAIAAGAPVERIVVFDATDGATTAAGVPITPFKDLAADGDAAFPADVKVTGADTLCIPYSSGTSGMPKGVELTHTNVVANLVQLNSAEWAVKMSPKDVLIGVLPFYHIYGLVVILNLGIMQGVKTITMPKFDPGMFLKLMKQHGVTVAHVAPPLVNFLAKHPAVDAVLPLPALKELFSGAAPLGPELCIAAKTRLDIAEVRQGYGMTEMSPVSHITPYGDDNYGPIGRLLPGMVAKVISTETGELCGPGERGELCCKGPNIMKGYLNKPEETAKCMDADGFLHTGDVCVYDEDGIFTVVDRVKELIKVKGFQVPPAELEAVIGGFEKVADVAVIGIADERAGELPKAYVVKQKGHEGLTEAEVKEFVAGKVAVYKQLAHVEFVESVPKSAAGKILRKQLRQMEAERAAAAKAD